jgi:predicted DNA binding CopG/RHH family protein
MFDNEPYESDNEYLDESDDDTQYKDIENRRNDQSKTFSVNYLKQNPRI